MSFGILNISWKDRSVSFGILQLGEVGKVNFGIFELGDASFRT